MSLKRSINAKDIMESLEKKQAIIEQPLEKEQDKEEHINSEQNLSHTFLSKIKKSQRKNRSKSTNYSVVFEQTVCNSKQGRAVAIQQNQARIQQNNQQRLSKTPTVIFQTQLKSLQKVVEMKKKLPFKVKRGIKSVKLRDSRTIKNIEYSKQRSVQIEKFAKTITLKPEIKKTKIFSFPKQKIQMQNIKNSYLNAYQLSIKRKNINILKMKLNGLGQKADVQEKKCCHYLDEMIKENQIKKSFKDKLRKLQIIRKKFQSQDKDKNHQVFLYSTIFNRQNYIIDPEDNYDITSQTIQIRDVSKSKPDNKNFVIHRKSLMDKTSNDRYTKNPQDIEDQSADNQSNFHSIQFY